MHSVLIILGGLALWSSVLLARTMFDLRVGNSALCLGFCAVWLIAAGINLAMGMHYAGYSLMEELSFFILVFGVPAATAAMTTRC